MNMSDKNKTEELKACPFCGDERVAITSNGHEMSCVYCEVCGAEGANAKTDALAFAVWNTRPEVLCDDIECPFNAAAKCLKAHTHKVEADNRKLKAELNCLKSETIHTMNLCKCGDSYKLPSERVCKACRIEELDADNAQLEIYLKDERDKSRGLEAMVVKAKTTINSLLPVTMSLCPVCEKYGVTGKQNICDKCTIELMKAELLTHQWIRSEDRLPEVCGEVILYNPNERLFETIYCTGSPKQKLFCLELYTHWRPITLPTDIEKGN
jgi:Lar family restriction alleviation protein